MALARKLYALRGRYTRLNAHLKKERQRPYPDDFTLQTLKRLRLLTRDEIHTILTKLKTARRNPAQSLA